MRREEVVSEMKIARARKEKRERKRECEKEIARV